MIGSELIANQAIANYSGIVNTYPHEMPQPASDPWNYLRCGLGYAGTFEGMGILNIINGTHMQPSVLRDDIQYGIRGTQWQQYNPEWLAEQEEPPTVDPTYACKLQRLVAVLGMQEQFTGTTINQDNLDDAKTDDEGNDLGWMYMWDLDRPTGDDGGGKAAIRVSALNAAGYACPLIPTTINIGWETHGRAHGMSYQNGEFVRGAGVSSDTYIENASVFYRQPIDENGVPTGNWQIYGYFTPDITGRWKTPPAKELGYQYGTISIVGGTVPDVVGEFVTRQYQYLTIITSSGGKEVYVIEHSTNMIFVLEYDATDGLELIYTSPADRWYQTAKSQVPYAIPKQLVTAALSSGSPAGYVDKNSVLYVYHVAGNALHKLTSSNMGVSWGADAIMIPSTQNISKSVEANVDGRQYCFALDTSGNFWCYQSSSHFADSAWTLNVNKFAITTGMSATGNPGWYFARGKFNAFCFDSSNNRRNYSSSDFGKTWTEVVVI